MTRIKGVTVVHTYPTGTHEGVFLTKKRIGKISFPDFNKIKHTWVALVARTDGRWLVLAKAPEYANLEGGFFCAYGGTFSDALPHFFLEARKYGLAPESVISWLSPFVIRYSK